MNNINQTVYNYLEVIYPIGLEDVVLNITMLDEYGLDVSELIENIAYSKDLPIELKRDAVDLALRDLTINLIQHLGIHMGDQRDLTLSELTTILEGLKQLENSEDHVLLRYFQVTQALEEPRELFIEVMKDITSLSELILMEGIGEVEDGFRERLIMITQNRLEIPQERIDPEETDSFMSYIGEQDCLGKELYLKGYNTFPEFEHLTKLLPFNLSDYFREKLDRGIVAQTALDFLSLCMITSDAMSRPLEFFEVYSEPLNFTNIDKSNIKNTLVQMHRDFTNFHKELVKYKAQNPVLEKTNEEE